MSSATSAATVDLPRRHKRATRMPLTAACGASARRKNDGSRRFGSAAGSPDEVSATVHDRMPVIVQVKDYQRWLDPENEDVADILAMPPAAGWIAYPVSRRVNSPKNDGRGLMEPDPV
jgi:putative SOS response-associated peptidase YedK